MIGHSKLSSNDEQHGLMCRAMALKVKYRVLTNGKKACRMPLRMMGVHPDNRKRVYPQADTVQGLGISFKQMGYCQEEADYQGVCVQAAPPEVDPKAGYGMKEPELIAYQKVNCAGHPSLMSCFMDDQHVLYTTLSHSHLLLVLLCWMNRAKWTIDPAVADEDKFAKFLDAEGRLNLKAAETDDDLAELVLSCRDGLLMETLSYVIEKEEPQGCSLISAALNLKNQTGLRTTELTALAVLNGVVTREMSLIANVAKQVLFTTVRQKVAEELYLVAEDPEFIELFDLVISLGAGSMNFVTDLLDYGSRFVDQKRRQLRFCAFAVPNKLPAGCPHVKVAVFKRAYKKTPVWFLPFA